MTPSMTRPTQRPAPYEPMLPRVLVRALGAVVVFCLLLAAGGSFLGLGTLRNPELPVLATATMNFQDQPDGSVAVLAPDGALIETLAPGTNGFLRGVMRGFARERKLAKVGHEQPFVVVAHGNGQISLTDPATGRTVEMSAFGQVNAAVFHRLVTLGASKVGDRQAAATTLGEKQP